MDRFSKTVVPFSRTSRDAANPFNTEWPTELEHLVAMMKLKRDTFKKHLNKSEFSTIDDFINNWDQYGNGIKTQWNDVTKGTPTMRSFMGMGKKKMGHTGTHPSTGSMDYAFDGKLEEIAKMKSEHDADLRKRDQKMDEMEAKVNSLTNQLSLYMNRSMSMDERNVESISSPNRPSNLVDDYKGFCNNHWIEAKEAVDQKTSLSEKEKCCFLNNILWVSYEEMNFALKKQKINLLQVLSNPFNVRVDDHNQTAHPRKCVTPQIPEDLELGMSSFLKTQGTNFAFGNHGEDILKRAVLEKSVLDYASTLGSSRQMEKYCHGACELSWKMLTQRPPMTFDMASAVNRDYDTQEQELFFGSEDPSKSGRKVLYYVHPAVYHGERASKGKLLVKGIVFVGMA